VVLALDLVKKSGVSAQSVGDRALIGAELPILAERQ
jgi:hypothetical protein